MVEAIQGGFSVQLEGVGLCVECRCDGWVVVLWSVKGMETTLGP